MVPLFHPFSHTLLTVGRRQEKGRRLTDVNALQEDVADIVFSSGELSNTHAAKIIAYRSEQHAALDLGSFLTFFKDSFAFVVKCERICNKMIVGLRGPVMDQVWAHRCPVTTVHPTC